MSVISIQVILIVGCQRSGTTLLGQILGSHPNAVLIDEDDGATPLALALCSSGCLDPDLLRPALLKARTKYRDDDRITAEGDLGHGITHVVLKAPNATYELEALQRLTQPPRLLFAVRDVRDVVASIARLPHIMMVANQVRRIRGNPAAAQRFSSDLERLDKADLAAHVGSAIVWRIKNSYQDQFTSAPLDAMLVRYEEVVGDTELATSRLYQHVGLQSLAHPGHPDVMRGMGPGLTLRSRPVDSASVQRWQRSLTPTQEQEVWDEAGDLMRTFGYERTPAIRPKSNLLGSVLASPVIATGRGGSGTRLLSLVLQQLGVFMGNRLNKSADSIEWVDLIYEMAIKRMAANCPASPSWKGELHARAATVLDEGKWSGTRWGWKLPESMLVLPELAEAHPDAVFIHLVRDPLDTCLRRTHMTSRTGNPIGNAALAAAYRQLGWKRPPADDPDHIRNAASWVMQVGAMRAHVATSGLRCLELTYERLVENPQSVADNVAAFLCLDRAAVVLPVDFNRVRQWSLDDPRASEVWEICGEVASLYGYRLPELACQGLIDA